MLERSSKITDRRSTFHSVSRDKLLFHFPVCFTRYSRSFIQDPSTIDRQLWWGELVRAKSLHRTKMVGFPYSIFHSIPQDILKFCKNSNVPKTGHSPHFSSEKRLKTYASKSNSLLFQHSHFPGCQCSKWHSLFKVFSASFKIRCLTMSVLIKMNKKVVAIALKTEIAF